MMIGSNIQLTNSSPVLSLSPGAFGRRSSSSMAELSSPSLPSDGGRGGGLRASLKRPRSDSTSPLSASITLPVAAKVNGFSAAAAVSGPSSPGSAGSSSSAPAPSAPASMPSMPAPLRPTASAPRQLPAPPLAPGQTLGSCASTASSIASASTVATAASTASAASSVAPAVSATPTAAPQPLPPGQGPDGRKAIASPQEFFAALLRSRGYPGTMFCSLKCGYHNSPTEYQTASYGVTLTRAVRSSDLSLAQSLLACGLHPNACNRFDESVVHAACRRGESAIIRALVDAGASVCSTDDFGRTPLHDACWTPAPNFDSVRMLLDRDPWLLCVSDCRGSPPLGYVRRAHWAVWIGFLSAIADRYWPDVTNNPIAERVPPLALVEPNSRPLPDPLDSKAQDLEVIKLLAEGRIAPRDLERNEEETAAELKAPRQQDCTGASRAVFRITLDPLRRSGSNATTMVKDSQLNTAGLFEKVNASPVPVQVLDCT
ncbi:hypothetical protein ACHAWF_010363 [Thalassiosira exigua]